VKINMTDESGLNDQAFTPSVHVLPDGTVGVTYYDFRNNDSGTGELETDHFFVHCHPTTPTTCTNPANWTEEQITTASFNLRFAPVARGYFLGDYVGLTHTSGGAFLAFFGQSNSAGDPATVYSSLIEPVP